MVVIKLSRHQQLCPHKALRIRVSEEKYFKYGKYHHKVEIVCVDCDVCVARAGEVWLNRPETIRGVLQEHWPALLEGTKSDGQPKEVG